MKHFRKIALCSISLFISWAVADDCSRKAECCHPAQGEKVTYLNGAGSTLQGQSNDTTGVQVVGNSTISTILADSMNHAFPCPTVRYNNVDAVTNVPFDQGSPAGINQTLAGKVAFGGSDSPPDASLVYPNGPLLVFPIAVAGIVIIYNLPHQASWGNDSLQITPEIAAGIFSGQFTNWQSIALAGSNVNVVDQSLTVTPFVRFDGSGTTYDFTQWLKCTATFLSNSWTLQGTGPFTPFEWQSAIANLQGFGPIVTAKGTNDMLQAINNTPGAVGYVGYNNYIAFIQAATVAKPNNLGVALLPDFFGDFVTPTPAAFEASLPTAGIPDNLIVPGICPQSMIHGAWPISRLTNIVVQQLQPTTCQALELKELLRYYATVGQNAAESYSLGKLNASILAQYFKNIDLLKTVVLPEPVNPCSKKQDGKKKSDCHKKSSNNNG